MTEEIEAHVLKKYEILQKLGNFHFFQLIVRFNHLILSVFLFR
jgi:hypothetical protein